MVVDYESCSIASLKQYRKQLGFRSRAYSRVSQAIYRKRQKNRGN